MLPLARLPSFLDVCALAYGHASTQTYSGSLSFCCASPQFTREVACGIPQRRIWPSPRLPPAHSAWDQGALSSAVCFPWRHTKTILLQIGARSLEVSKCLSDCLSHRGASSTFLIPVSVQSYCSTASFESLNIYLWRLKAPFPPKQVS